MPEAAVWAEHYHTAFQLCEIIMLFPFPIKDLHLDIKFKYRLCHNHGTQSCCYWCSWVLYFLFSPELFIQSICVTLSLCNAHNRKWERCSLLFPHQQRVRMQLPGAPSASLHSLIQSSPLSSGTHAFLPGGYSCLQPAQGWQTVPAPLKIRPIDLFQELHSNS